MTKKKAVLSKRLEALMAGFDEAAKDWGRLLEQGTRSEVTESDSRHVDCMKELENHLIQLEQENKRLRKQVKDQSHELASCWRVL